MEPTMRDMARAAGWLQDKMGQHVPNAEQVEALSWLIASAREDDKQALAKLRAQVLAIDPTKPYAVGLLVELQRELSAPEEATVVT